MQTTNVMRNQARETHIRRMRLLVTGVVQGVGFRPFVYSLARRHGLSGYVLNDSRGVVVEVEGNEPRLEAFARDIQTLAPPQARIGSVSSSILPPVGFKDFRIDASLSHREKSAFVSPDLATCPDCLRELFDPNDRRYRYPFLNCTNCGPRFTIIKDVPYDRLRTTMNEFVMCPSCKREYGDPADRRFHAEPDACPECGPGLTLLDRDGEGPIGAQETLGLAASLLRRGYIIAIKGMGGYHLACDACNEKAVASLRRRKHREDRPFAIMVNGLATARRLCFLEPDDALLLESPKSPIVLLRRRMTPGVAPSVAPGQNYLGVMLPYTPVHHLLVADSGLVLVMTSGNVSDEPIAYQDEDALNRLGGIADYFLVHNRKIHIRCDDSVARTFRGKTIMIRRSRGYVPDPVEVPFEFARPVLSCGGHLKNTFGLAKGSHVFLSHHVGDLENAETLASFEEGIAHFSRVFDIEPEVIAHDLHPEYLSTKYAMNRHDLVRVGVQHHHAHVASCLADNGLAGPAIGVAFDGAGYGEDGHLWGGEFLIADFAGFKRLAHFEYFPLPGGEMAIREPWRLAALFLHRLYGDAFLDLDLDFVKHLDRHRWKPVKALLESGVNCPKTSSAGRLFDVAAAVAGLRKAVNYEGQAAVEFEMAAGFPVSDNSCSDAGESCCDDDDSCYGYNRYGYKIRDDNECGCIIIDPLPVFGGMVTDLLARREVKEIAVKFHNTMSDVIANTCRAIREKTGLTEVALSGGVFQNRLLLDRTCGRLEELGFAVYINRQVPANDGGIALGQAVIANARWRECASEFRCEL